MLPIYICEDVRQELKYLKDIIEKYILMENLDMQVVCATTDPHFLLNHLKQHPTLSLYFLDLDLNNNDYNGLTLGHEIRKYDTRGFIVIVTTYGEMASETFRYKIEAMDFITKDNIFDLNSRVVECLKEAFNLYISSHNTSNEKILSLKIGGVIKTYTIDDIYCIETLPESHRIQILSKNSCNCITMSLNDIAVKLNENFYRCHKSYIINMLYIKRIERYNATLQNDYICPISIRLYKDFQKTYSKFVEKLK